MMWGAIMIGSLFLFRYKENEAGKTDEDALTCQDNYAVFAVSVFQYITLAAIFSTGYPHRRPMYTNREFLSPVIEMTIGTSSQPR